jgi:hypothetical protein
MKDSEEEPSDARPRRDGEHHRKDGSKEPCCTGIRNANEFEHLGNDEDWPSRWGPKRLGSTVISVLAGTTVALGGL